MKFACVAILVLLMGPVAPAAAQGAAPGVENQVDAQGRRQGPWRLLAPQQGRTGYADGQLIEEGVYLDGRRNGKWVRYWPSGRVMSEITYQQGRPKGPYTTYYDNGRTEEQGSWELDRNTGAFKRWHPNGELAQEFVFDQEGVRDGVQRYYHDNGKLAVSVNIEQGREDGTLKRYFPNGDLQQVAEFNGGVMDPARSRYVEPEHSLPSPPVPSGKTAPPVSAEEVPNALQFRENGFNTLYDKQKRLSQVGQFKAGRLHDGRRYRYDASGRLFRIEVYQGGRHAGDAVLTDEDLR